MGRSGRPDRRKKIAEKFPVGRATRNVLRPDTIRRGSWWRRSGRRSRRTCRNSRQILAEIKTRRTSIGWLAERKGFEPSIRVNVYALSRGAPSATRPPLQRPKPLQISVRWGKPDLPLGAEIIQESCRKSLRLRLKAPAGQRGRRACARTQPPPATAFLRRGSGPRLIYWPPRFQGWPGGQIPLQPGSSRP